MCCIAYHKILLVDTKDTSFFITVVRIEEKSQVFGNIGLVKGNTVLYNAFIYCFHIKQVELIGAVVVAGNFNIVHTGCKGEVFVWNFIGYICFCQPGSILNPRIWFFCLFVVFKQLFEKTEMVI